MRIVFQYLDKFTKASVIGEKHLEMLFCCEQLTKWCECLHIIVVLRTLSFENYSKATEKNCNQIWFLHVQGSGSRWYNRK